MGMVCYTDLICLFYYEVEYLTRKEFKLGSLVFNCRAVGESAVLELK